VQAYKNAWRMISTCPPKVKRVLLNKIKRERSAACYCGVDAMIVPRAALRAQEMAAQKEKRLRMSSEPFSLKQLVRLAGIEPTTPWFVAKYSIQLSYSRPRHAL
jgi:hypothetical protein